MWLTKVEAAWLSAFSTKPAGFFSSKNHNNSSNCCRTIIQFILYYFIFNLHLHEKVCSLGLVHWKSLRRLGTRHSNYYIISSYSLFIQGGPGMQSHTKGRGWGVWSGSWKKIWGGTDFVCILTYFSIIYLKPARLRLFRTYLAHIFYSINFLCPD
jgi:hypothetical protein